MVAIDRSGRHSITALLLVLNLLLPNSAARPEITPLRTSATFSAQSPQNRWSVPIKSPDGSTAYVLSLDPDFDVGHHVVTVELVLRPGAKPHAPNLFDPTRRRHGLQVYDFAADDLASGAQKSAFGAKRTLSVKSLGLVVRIHVSKVRVSTASAGNYQLDALELQIEVDNSNP
jgi:hypothetical protein